MASSVTTDYLSSVLKVMTFDFDPDGSDAADVSWQDMRDFGAVLMQLFKSIGTGAVITFKILANPESGGSGADAEVKEHALGTAVDAVGDFVNLECLASELPPLGTDLRYVSASASLATDTDECVFAYVFGQPRFAHGELTEDTIA
jgi:hypothetical protein